MLKWYVEGKSGSRVRSPRCGATPSCSPLWERYRDEHSTCDVRPRRRLYDGPERAGARVNPSDRPGGRRAGPRPAGGLGRGLRPVGPVAQAQGPDGHPGATGTRLGGARLLRGRGFLRGPGGPLRPCAGLRPRGCLHRPGHAAGTGRTLGGDPHSPAMVRYPAAGGPRPGRTGAGHGSGSAGHDGIHRNRSGSTSQANTHGQAAGGRQGPHRRAAGGATLPPTLTHSRPA